MAESPMHGLTKSGYYIFLDRYARKDVRRESLGVGDVVLVCLDPQKGHREIGQIVERNDEDVLVEFGGNGVTKRERFTYERVDKPVELDPREMHARVARAVASVETDPPPWENSFRELLDYFTPAGRILAAAGVEEKLTCFNCFVLAAPDDSLEGIYERCLDMVKTMRRGGGVGIPLSKLRPRGSYVRAVNGRSSGAVGWSAIYAQSTGLIEQGGSRRGALILVLEDWHPDVEEFIHSKRDSKFNLNCNQSVAISDAFMEAVENDGDWQLVFPDTAHPAYHTEWDGDLTDWRTKYPDAVNVYKTMKARDLWDQIIESAHESAEPGLWFKDRASKASNSYYYPEGKIIAVNPCGEEPLPAWAVCNLGHLLLHKFAVGPIGSAEVNWHLLANCTRLAVRFLDNIVDYTWYFDSRNEKQQKAERRVGLGTLGLAELLIRCGIRYGANKRCLDFLYRLYSFIAEKAYEASISLAKEKGPFPLLDAEKFVHSGFMQSMPISIQQRVREEGIRNVTLLTQAPTGTVGTMLGSSTGIEPFFALDCERNSRVGKFTEHVAVVDEFFSEHPDLVGERPAEVLPDYFVTAQDITPEDHAHVQAEIQRWVDASISKTINLLSDCSPEQVGECYRLLYDLSCKGGTVYRDGSRPDQILKAKTGSEDTGTDETPTSPKPEVIELPDEMDAQKVRVRTPMGSMHVTVSYLDGEPRESFAQVGKGGSDIYADLEGMNRMVSLLLRLDSPVPPNRRLELLRESLEGIGGRHQEGHGPRKILSLPDALAHAYSKVLAIWGHTSPGSDGTAGAKRSADHCPKCGSCSLVREESCEKCHDCGHSEC